MLRYLNARFVDSLELNLTNSTVKIGGSSYYDGCLYVNILSEVRIYSVNTINLSMKPFTYFTITQSSDLRYVSM